MKGQISIEFMSFLIIALLASAILVSELNDRAIQHSKSSPYKEAQAIAQKVSYTFDYAKSHKNFSKSLVFEPDLEEDYNISVGSGQTVVNFDAGSASFPTRYQGAELNLNSTERYVVRYDGDFSVIS